MRDVISRPTHYGEHDVVDKVQCSPQTPRPAVDLGGSEHSVHQGLFVRVVGQKDVRLAVQSCHGRYAHPSVVTEDVQSGDSGLDELENVCKVRRCRVAGRVDQKYNVRFALTNCARQ